jgi:teichoic acid transport system ATP-binding protein
VFFQAKCYHKFEEFKQQGKTILFVSHDLTSIAKYCDRVVLLNKGVKLREGGPKEIIDAYKQVLVGQYREDGDTTEGGLEASETADNGDTPAQNAATSVNPELLEYGNGAATINDYYITDKNGTRTSAIIKGEPFTIHFSVDFLKDIEAPIFAFTVKNIKGIEITGTNTMYERAFLSPVKAGDKKKVTFTQDMNLQGGEYLLSFGTTGYEKDDFVVYHRLYDVINLTVISDKDTVGYYDMNSVITVE